MIGLQLDKCISANYPKQLREQLMIVFSESVQKNLDSRKAMHLQTIVAPAKTETVKNGS